MEQPKQGVCTIRIMFPVISDEQAIGFKKQIDQILKDAPDAQIQFGLSTVPLNSPIR